MNDPGEIIAKCKKNDRQAQAALYGWLAPKLLGVCLRYFKDRGEAEDVMQDSFVKIFMSLGSYRSEGSFDAWARRITANTALTKLKVNNRIKMDRNIEQLENSSFSEEEALHVDEKDLLACLDELPVGYRAILNLFLFEGFSHKEIAARLEITESTSRSQYTRARQLMARLVKERIRNSESRVA